MTISVRVMIRLTHIIALLLLTLGPAHCHQKRFRRSALNTPYYQIVPNIERRNIWESEEFYSNEDTDVDLDRVWREFNDIDGDFGMRSSSVPRFKQNLIGKYNPGPGNGNRRTRNMKVNVWQILARGLNKIFLAFLQQWHSQS